MTNFAVTGLIQVIFSLLFIGISWWALQAVRWDVFLVKPNSPPAKALVVILSIILGSLVTQFFTNYFAWSKMIRFLF